MAKSFSNRMRKIGDLMTANAQEIIREAALACSQTVIQRTPVKTGKARTNWNVSFGKVNTSVIEGSATADRGVNGNVASARALINAANRISKWKMGSGNILIANSVGYILDLDRGTSKQAMEGMSIFGIAAAKAVLKKGRLLRGR